MKDKDSIMEDVYATRREISSRFGNDPKRYIAAIRDMKRNAKEAGMTFFEYCLSDNRASEQLMVCEGE